MASTGKMVLTGCGIGCLLLLLIVGGIGTCGFLGIKRVVDQAESLDVAYDDLEEQFGAASDFVPAADGTIDPGRLETFLATRRALIENGGEVDRLLRTIDGAEGGESGRIAKIRAGLKIVPALIGYTAVHSHALFDHGLGVGEHAYLYSLVYFVMLEHDPGDGPDFRISGDDEGDVQVNWHGRGSQNEHAREDRARQARRNLNSLLAQVLKNQRDALVESGDDSSAWHDQLSAEIDAMHRDRGRLPWQDGLPEPIAASLEPFRADLEAVWSPYLNAMDMTAAGNFR